MTDFEKLLAALLSGDTSALPEPNTKVEKYLAKALGVWDGELPLPTCDADVYLYQLALNGAGGGDEIEITDCSNLFKAGARFDIMDGLFKLIPNIDNANYMCSAIGVDLCEDILAVLPANFISLLENAQSCTYLFYNSASLRTLPDITFKRPCAVNHMCASAGNLVSVGKIYVPDTGINGLMEMFGSATKLQSFDSIAVGDNAIVSKCEKMFISVSKMKTAGELKFRPQNASYMFNNCYELVDVPTLDMSECTNICSIFNGCKKLRGTINFGKTKVGNQVSGAFTGCENIEAILDFYVSHTGSISGGCFPYGTQTAPTALKRLTFHPEASFTGFSNINLSYGSFMREGMVEFFNSLVDLSASTASSTYKTIKITGNPCALDELTLVNQTSYSSYYTLDELIAAAVKRYRGVDGYMDAPIKYYLYGTSSVNDCVEATLGAITEDMFAPGPLKLLFFADTVTVPENVKLTDDDIAIATAKGWSITT